MHPTDSFAAFSTLQDLQLANSTLAQQLVRMQAEGGEVRVTGTRHNHLA